MPRATIQQRLELAKINGFGDGRRYEREEIAKNNQAEFMRLKREQVQAVTELIKVQTQALSKAGYLISQLNKEKGW